MVAALPYHPISNVSIANLSLPINHAVSPLHPWGDIVVASLAESSPLRASYAQQKPMEKEAKKKKKKK